MTRRHSNFIAGLKARKEYFIAKATRMKLLNEERTYPWEYDTCLEKIALLERLILRTEDRRLSSSIKPSP